MAEQPSMQTMFGGRQDGGFLGLPRALPGEVGDARIAVIGAPGATPYPAVGSYCQGAPDAIRGALGWPNILDHYDFDLDGRILVEGITAVDWGNLDYDDADFAANREVIQRAVERCVRQQVVPLVLGGDDSIPIPVLQGFGSCDALTIVQIDAHIDWRDEVGGETLGLSSNMRRASEMPWVRDIIQVGARGLGSARPQDVSDALDWGVRFVPMSSVYRDGIQQIIDMVPADQPVFVTVDIDGLDPAVVPAVIGPAPGGLQYQQVLEIFRGVASKAPIAGFDLVELVPDNDVGGRGALVAARLTAVMMGLIARQLGQR